jgi:hypothetical protein
MIGEACDHGALQATGVDVVEVGEVHIDIQGEAVPGDPTAAGHSDGDHLLALHPDSGVSRIGLAKDVVASQDTGTDRLKAAHPSMEIMPLRWKLADGVAHDLARSMEGHIPSTLDLEYGYLARFEDIRCGASAATECVDRLVLEQQEGVAYYASNAGVELVLHSSMGVGVGKAPKPLDTKR